LRNRDKEPEKKRELENKQYSDAYRKNRGGIENQVHRGARDGKLDKGEKRQARGQRGRKWKARDWELDRERGRN
ncbi:hypothetical protein, partial [Klebsiella pneumoniae]|uniref:hypothetical protein n=1 Tax=Klebsiella pneumoniae TaxID=573 RepID=UPI00210D18B5